MATAFPKVPSFSWERSNKAPEPSGRVAGIAVVVALHVLLIAALLQYAPARRSLAQVAPVIVSLITPERVEPPPPKPPAQPKTKLAQHAPVERVLEPPPVLGSAPVESPITIPPAPPEPVPAPVAQAVYAPEPSPPPPVTPPRYDADYLRNPPPPYPALARRLREQGKVLVRVLVNIDGGAERVEVKVSSGSARLDQSALDTIKGWKFVPARQGEASVPAWVIVPVTFTLEG